MKADLAELGLLAFLFILLCGWAVRLVLLGRIGSAIYAVQKELAKSNRRADGYFDRLPQYRDYVEESNDPHKWD